MRTQRTASFSEGLLAGKKMGWTMPRMTSINSSQTLPGGSTVDATGALTCFLIGETNAESSRALIGDLLAWDPFYPECPVTLILNGGGGFVFDGLALYDVLRRLSDSGHRVTILALGRAASMGGVLLQAGDERVMSSNGLMLMHEMRLAGSSEPGVGRELPEFSVIESKVLAILSSRSTIGAEELRSRRAEGDWWLDASEALEFGFIDRIW